MHVCAMMQMRKPPNELNSKFNKFSNSERVQNGPSLKVLVDLLYSFPLTHTRTLKADVGFNKYRMIG